MGTKMEKNQNKANEEYEEMLEDLPQKRESVIPALQTVQKSKGTCRKSPWKPFLITRIRPWQKSPGSLRFIPSSILNPRVSTR